MKQIALIFCFFIYFSATAQNWNVFNKNYRYNYKFDNSQLISNVLFAETVSQFALDTLYAMNEIGAVLGNSLTPNVPQFLMKKLFKKANGNVELQDTMNITIVPTCSLNQIWIFDTDLNLTATCVAISTVNIFNVVDSIRTVIVNNADSVVWSKQFGILQFPKPYAQDKYYKLAGIENKASYDSIPLYGEKVPNAWDIYKFDSGDKYNFWYQYAYGSPPNQAGCGNFSRIINSRAIASNGYSYCAYQTSKSYAGTMWGDQNRCYGSPPFGPPVVSGTVAVAFINLSDPTLLENAMYPGMYNSSFSGNYDNIVTFGLDSYGTFYKYIGASCQTGNSPQLPTLNTNSPGLWYGVGLGKIGDNPWLFEGLYNYCVTSFIKGTLNYFGPYYTVGVLENQTIKNESLLFPNPAKDKLTLNAPLNSKVNIFDVVGNLIFSEKTREHVFTSDVSLLPNGLYFIEIQNDSFKHCQKLIIQH